MKAKVYSVTTLHGEQPFQIAIVEFENGARKTVRIEGPRVEIGDAVEPTAELRFRAAGASRPRA